MTAAALARSDRTAAARDLLAAERPSRRGAALLHAIAANEAPAACGWRDLGAVPEWLRGSADERLALARQVALTGMADALAGAIDGRWLGALAGIVGEDALDRAMTQAGTTPLTAGARVEADRLDARGLALLRAALPPALRRFLPPGEVAPESAKDAAALVTLAQRA